MNRREFIKAGSSAFFIAAAGRAFGADAPSNRVRLAIVGCHAKGRGISVMRAAMLVPGVEIAYVCDVDSRAMDFAAAEVEKIGGYKPRKEKDLRKLLEDPALDGIISETPDHWHAWSAVMAMRAGKHVYVEKPCCFCPREGEILVDTWRETGKVLQVGSQRRASLNYRAAFDWLRDNGQPLGELKWGKCWYMANRASIGRGNRVAVPEWLDWELWQGPAPRQDYRDNIVHYNWHWFRNWGTGESGNNAPHFADVARWALGVKFPKRVSVMGGSLFPRQDDDYEFADSFNMSFEFPGDKLITFELTSHVNAKPYMDVSTGAMVYGDKGAIYFGPSDDVKVFDAKGNVLKAWDKDSSSTQVGSLTDPTARLDFLHQTNFVECIRANSQGTFVPANEGYMSSYMPIAGNVALATHETFETDPNTGRPLNCKAAEALWAREYAKGWELV